MKRLFKTLLLSVVVLLLGQIPLGQDTFAGWFYKKVIGLCQWGGESVRSGFRLAKSSIPALKSEPEKVTRRNEYETKTDEEGLTHSDRESLMRALQE